MKIQPFADTGDKFTPITNYMLDIIMPSLPANAWKVLCFVFRKTRGWQKEQDRLAYSQIETGTGINSSATISQAIKVLMEKNYIIKVPGSAWKPMGYQINSALEIEVHGSDSTSETKVTSETKPHASALEIEVHSGLKTEVLCTSEIEDTKERSKERSKGDGGRADRAPRAPPIPKQSNLDSFNQAIVIYKELSGKKQIAPTLTTLIVNCVSDLDLWRAVISNWAGCGYNVGGVKDMLDWYDHPEKMAARLARNSGQLPNSYSNGKVARPPADLPTRSADDSAGKKIATPEERKRIIEAGWDK